MENPAQSASSRVEGDAAEHPEPEQEEPEEEEEDEKEEDDEEEEEEEEENECIKRANVLIDKITCLTSRNSPNPKPLHALAALLEEEESRFIHESGISISSNARSSHNIGRLGNLLRGNDEFFELVSSKLLSDSRYSMAVRAAAARLLVACASTWLYPHVFEEAVLENIKKWATEDVTRPSVDEYNSKEEASGHEASDQEMLKTFATGLLALALNGNGPIVEEVLNIGLAAKLMRYLRVAVLGEINVNQKESNLNIEGKQTGGASSVRAREDGKSRFRHISDIACPDFSKMAEDAISEEQYRDKDNKYTDDCSDDGEDFKRTKDNLEIADETSGKLHTEADNLEYGADERRRRKEWREGKIKLGGNKSSREEDNDENGREDPSKRRAERGTRCRGKPRIADSGEILASPGAGIRLGVRTNKDKNTGKWEFRQDDRVSEVDHQGVYKEENDEADRDCKIGTKDISELVKKARLAAENEAKTANAPLEAIQAAGEAAAELVKSAAVEALNSTNDEEAAVAAASTAMAAVVDAALSTEVSRKAPNGTEEWLEVNDDVNEKDGLQGSFILDVPSLGRLREQYSIQCLERLGEYVEVLGPVLHEKGVDVCLALLQRELKNEKNLTMLSDLLKLICALAAHRKFAALFVDRGGIQKLLAVPRVLQTYLGISMCLFAIGSLQGIMERVCALPAEIVHSVVDLALQLFECSQDQARRNAALFFGVAFVFRAVLEAFDAKEGLQKMLEHLRNAANVRSGANNGASATSNGASTRNNLTAAEVLSASEKQLAYHTCVALRQYFRAHLIMLVDSLRPNKSHRSGVKATSSARVSYKPIDISNEAVDSVFAQLQHDRKLAPSFVRARWPAVEKFLSFNGHTILLELSQQSPPSERYLHDLALYALGVLHIVTLVPNARRLVVGATLNNERLGMAVILEAASGATYGDTEVIHSALLVLVNLVCPPPSFSSKAITGSKNLNTTSNQVPGGHSEVRERNTERTLSVDRGTADRSLAVAGVNDLRERSTDERSNLDRSGPVSTGNIQSGLSSPAVVGDRRISLGPGAGCAGLAAYMEQCYRQARDAVRANNGIRVLLHLLHPRTPLNPSNLDCIHALACRVLLGLAKDDTIAHILTKLQVGKLLSELVRESGNQVAGSSGEQSKWQAELSQVAMELIAIVTNAGRASTLAATDAAAPTLRRIERAAIAARTPITYHSTELLQLIHEHLVASGLSEAASALLKEAQLTPLPPLAAPALLTQRPSVQESSGTQLQWPAGRIPGGFLTNTTKISGGDDEAISKSEALQASARKKTINFSLNIASNSKIPQSNIASNYKIQQSNRALDDGEVGKDTRVTQSGSRTQDVSWTPAPKNSADGIELSAKTPSTIHLKRKTIERDSPLPLAKRPAIMEPMTTSPRFMTPTFRRSCFSTELDAVATPNPLQQHMVDDVACNQEVFGSYLNTGTVSSSNMSSASMLTDTQSGNCERATLDSLVVQYLKHQHRQCPAPITTLPPLSLLHPHICPEPSRALEAPFNTAGRLIAREYRSQYGGMHGHRRDRQFVFSRFRPWRTCRDEASLLTSITFLGSSSRIATGCHAGEVKIFDTSSGNLQESQVGHSQPIALIQSAPRDDGSHLLLTSCSREVRLWDSSVLANGQLHTFENCKAARFNNSGSMFAAISSDSSHREILLYDVQTCNIEQRLSDNFAALSGTARSSTQSLVHFSPSDSMLLWNGILWDHRVSRPVHRFDQFTDYGGGGFHPAGNEVIINSEVWDLRKFRLLRSVPSLDQTVITFNATGDIIYATLRRNLEDIMSALHHRRTRHPLYAAFRTMDAVHYSDIALTVIDRCVLDLATEPTDSYIGLVAMDDSEEMDSSARIFEVGRRRPTDDDSDPDDGLESDEEDEVDSEADEDGGEDVLDDGDSDMEISSDEDDSAEEGDGDFDSNDDDDAIRDNLLQIISEEEGSQGLDSFSSDEDGSLGEFDEEFMII